MALFAIRNTMLEECIQDFQNIGLTENNDFVEGMENFNEYLSDALNKIQNDENYGPEERKLGELISKVIEPTWLEKKQAQLEDKLHKLQEIAAKGEEDRKTAQLKYQYELQAKSDQTGTFKKIWIKIKSFIVKIIQLITKALAKAHRFVKNRYLGYKIKKQTKVVAKKHGMDLGNNPLF